MSISKFNYSYLFLATVTKWEAGAHKDSKRVLSSAGTQYLLNTNRVDSIRSKGSYASCYYFDNPMDSRCSPAFMEISKTPAEIIAEMDKVPTHRYLTLPIYPKMDPTATAVDTTIEIENFAFAMAVTDSYASSQSIVFYSKGGNGFVRARVNKTLAQLLAMIV